MRALRPCLLALFLLASPATAGDVEVLRCPEEGRIPDIVVDADGVVHMAYGKEKDGYYVRAERAGATWSAPVRVNSAAGSVAVGRERGPRLALGKAGTLHALWQDDDDLGYARSTDGGRTWSPQRSLSDRAGGADVPTIAADGKGKVWAVWIDGRDGEDARNPSSGSIYLARSDDDGETFGAPYRAEYAYEGRACACCALDSTVGSDGRLRIVFRGALKGIRDVWLLEGDAAGARFQSIQVSNDDWRLDQCPMDGPIVAVEDGSRKIAAAWRSRDEVYWTGSPDGRRFAGSQAPAVSGPSRTYPSIRFGKGGSFLFAWVEGMDVVWELHDRTGKLEKAGRANGLPHRSRYAIVAGSDGVFHLVF